MWRRLTLSSSRHISKTRYICEGLAMFVEFTTINKKEKFKVNINKILMIFSLKNGTRVVLEDGSQYDVSEKYDYICSLLSRG